MAYVLGHHVDIFTARFNVDVLSTNADILSCFHF